MSSADMDSLLSADGIIGNVLSTMKAKNIPYVAIYTGLQPSRVGHVFCCYLICLCRNLDSTDPTSSTIKRDNQGTLNLNFYCLFCR